MMTMQNVSDIVLYNSMSKCKAPLQTTHPDKVTMYVCGPTVYNFAHIGNARPAVVFDVLARLLRRFYPQVIYARNFTDVDDKINAAALANGEPIEVITARYIQAYHEDMQALDVLQPDLEPRATEHISDIIALIETLLAKGHAYLAEAHVLFDVHSYAEYGHLSNRSKDDMLAGARVEVAPYKRDPMDFVLWKPSTAEQPGWSSPWGRGRPGWHIECSAMIEQHLGNTIDIHGGGQDLIFPHHENEIAQGTCAHDGALYCRTWVHNSFVTVNGQKMSKSLGNVLLLRDLLQEAPGEVVRFALLMTHYRASLDWTAKRLLDAKRTLSKWYQILQTTPVVTIDTQTEPDAEVLAALCDDLNTAQALARLHQLFNELDAATDQSQQVLLKQSIVAAGQLLGLLQQQPEQALHALSQNDPVIDVAWVEQCIADRRQARQQKNYPLADQIRQQLLDAGVQLEDTAEGTVWRRV